MARFAYVLVRITAPRVATYTNGYKELSDNPMAKQWVKELKIELTATKLELEERLRRIKANHRRPLEIDSKERAMQLENQEVVDALGNEARLELRQITVALAKIDSGEFGFCEECGELIGRQRLLAYPRAMKCIDCAELDDDLRRLVG